MAIIFPVIMSGGSGTRLWPLSRKALPKQYLELVGDGSLFSQTVTRMSPAAAGRPPQTHYLPHRVKESFQCRPCSLALHRQKLGIAAFSNAFYLSCRKVEC